MATLITGAGLIGCQTAALLAARGEPVVLLDLQPMRNLVIALLPLLMVAKLLSDVKMKTSVAMLMLVACMCLIATFSVLITEQIQAQPCSQY